MRLGLLCIGFIRILALSLVRERKPGAFGEKMKVSVMITEIGIVAGEIWHFLDRYGEIELEQLMVGLKRPRELILMSLGWLAREGHVLVEDETVGYKIRLREKEVTQ